MYNARIRTDYGSKLARDKMIRVSEEEYEALKAAKEELEDRQQVAVAGQSGVDLGSLALGAVAAIGAIRLLKWLTDEEE